MTRLHLWSDDRESEGKDGTDWIVLGLARSLIVEFVDRQAKWAAGQSDSGIAGLLARGWAIIYRHNTANTTDDARVFFEEVLRRDPDNIAALIGMGAADAAAVANLYVKDREPYLARAESLLNRVITLKPNASGAFYWLGVAQETRGQVDDALNSFTHAANLRPSLAPAYAQAGHLEAEMGRPSEGLAKIRYAISLNPRDPANGRWCLFAGQIELERGNLDAATEWMSCALQNMPRNPRVHATLAAIYALSGRMSEAAEQVATVRKLSGDLEMITSQSVAPLNSGSKIGGARLIEGWRKAMSAS